MTKLRTLATTALLAALTGCAGTPAGAPDALPTLTQPTAPPSGPTDLIKNTNVVVGTVTRGGTGPCYGLVTDDGVPYALYEAKERDLTIGTRIEVHTTPSRLRIDCGPGQLVEVTALQPLR